MYTNRITIFVELLNFTVDCNVGSGKQDTFGKAILYFNDE